MARVITDNGIVLLMMRALIRVSLNMDESHVLENSSRFDDSDDSSIALFSEPEDDVIVLLVMNIRLPLNQSPLSLPQLKQLKVSWWKRTIA